MRPPFPRNAEILAGLPPFLPMRSNTSTTDAMLCQQMGQFMKEGSLDLVRRNPPQRRVEPDFPAGSDGHPRGRSHPGVPPHDEHSGKRGSKWKDRLTGATLQIVIALFGAPGTVRLGCHGVSWMQISADQQSQAGEDPLHPGLPCGLPGKHSGKGRNRRANILIRRVTSQGEPDGGTGKCLRNTHRTKDMRGLDRTNHAG